MVQLAFHHGAGFLLKHHIFWGHFQQMQTVPKWCQRVSQFVRQGGQEPVRVLRGQSQFLFRQLPPRDVRVGAEPLEQHGRFHP